MPFDTNKKYEQKERTRKINISQQRIKKTMVHIHCKVMFNCKNRDWKEACMRCIHNKGQGYPKHMRTNNYKPIIQTDKPLTIDGRIRGATGGKR